MPVERIVIPVKGLDVGRAKRQRKKEPTKDSDFEPPPSPPEKIEKKKEKRPPLHDVYPENLFKSNGLRRYFVTSAQNNTAVHKDFRKALASLETEGVQLMITPSVYQNLTPFSTKEDRDVWWDEGLLPYMISEPYHFNEHLSCFPDIRPPATAINPLGGLLNRSKRSLIVGSPRMHVQSIPSPAGHLPTLFISTGSITIPNYRSGMPKAKALPGHTIGGLLIEVIDDAIFLWRHCEFKNDCFYNLSKKYTPDGIEYGQEAEALIWGDFHAEHHRKHVWSASLEMNQALKPKYNLFHDFISFEHSHHQTLFERVRAADVRADAGFKIGAQYLKEFTEQCPDTQAVMVPSNHDDHVTGFLTRYTHAAFPGDAVFYHKLMLEILTDKEKRQPFYHAMKLVTDTDVFNKVRFLRKAESFVVANHELGLHGSWGPSGSRGSAASLARMSNRCIIGHSHSVTRNDSVGQVGTSGPLDESFHACYASTMHAHIVLYPNATFTHLPIIDGKWHADKNPDLDPRFDPLGLFLD